MYNMTQAQTILLIIIWYKGHETLLDYLFLVGLGGEIFESIQKICIKNMVHFFFLFLFSLDTVHFYFRFFINRIEF